MLKSVKTPAQNMLATWLAMILIFSGLVALPLFSQASASGITAGKYGSQQVFDVQRSPAWPNCSVSGETTTYNSFTASSPTTPYSGSTGAQVPLTDGKYVMFFESGDSTLPWGMKLYNSANAELRYSGTAWVTEAEAGSAEAFAALPVFTPKGQIYGLGTEGFLHESQNGYGTFISNIGPLVSSVTYTPLTNMNDCVSGLAIANVSAALTSFNANTTPNATLNTVEPTESPSPTPSPTSEVESTNLGILGVNQSMKPISLAQSGTGTISYAKTSGEIPAGLTLDTATGKLSGTPTETGEFTFEISVSQDGSVVSTNTYKIFVASQVVFDNTKLRFGSGNQHSINNKGSFEQPFYKSPVNGNYYKLTYSSYPLDMAIGSGTGTSHWTTGVVRDLSGISPKSQEIDYSRFVVRAEDSNKRVGYGVISVATQFEINGQDLLVTNRYSLGESDSYVRIQTSVKNLSDTSARNVYIWVGTRDDWVGNTDQPVKTRGNLNGTDGAFQAVPSRSNPASALQITTDTEGALFYSTTPGTNIAVNDCCSFSNVYDIDPSNPEDPNLDPYAEDLSRGFDGSYAAVLPVGNLASQASTTITWFYAAGAIADLNDVAKSVAGATTGAPEVSRSGSAVTVSWSAPDLDFGRVLTGYQYRYYSQLDGEGNPIWTVSNTLPTSPRSATISNLSDASVYYFEVRSITNSEAGDAEAIGDWSSSSRLAATPRWTPASTTLNATVNQSVNQTILTSNATGLSLGSGATVTVSGLPTGVTATVSNEGVANGYPVVSLTGTPTVAGTYTVTVTITDSDGNVVSSEISYVVANPSSGGTTPTPSASPSPTPTISPRPVPVPTVSPTPSILTPITPSPSPSPTLGPVVLIPTLPQTPGVSYDTQNPIPQSLLDILARAIGYTTSLSGEPVLPELKPGNYVAYENGSEVLIQLLPTEDESGFILKGDGWELVLRATDSSGEPLRLDESGNLILNADRMVSFSGSGFAPGSLVKVWLFSEPNQIATVRADAKGAFEGSATLPTAIADGEHTVQLNGISPNGQLRSVSLGVVVQPIVAPVVAADPIDFGPISALLALLLLLIFFIVFFARRRKRKKEQRTGSSLPQDYVYGGPLGEPAPGMLSESLKLKGSGKKNRFNFGSN